MLGTIKMIQFAKHLFVYFKLLTIALLFSGDFGPGQELTSIVFSSDNVSKLTSAKFLLFLNIGYFDWIRWFPVGINITSVLIKNIDQRRV